MDSAQKMDDHSARSGALRVSFSRDTVGKQHAQARAGIGFQKEEDRFSEFLHLLDPHGRQNPVVNRVVQKQHLGRFDKHARQRKKAVIHKETDSRSHYRVQSVYQRSHAHHGKQRQNRADDPQREIIDQHLKTGRDPGFRHFVKFFDDPGGQRSDDHGADKHGDV